MFESIEIFKLVYIGIGPGIAFAVYIYYFEKWDPEPKSLVIKSFILGGVGLFSHQLL